MKVIMNIPKVSLLLVACALLAGCKTQRSISHSGYQDGASRSGRPCGDGSDPAFQYRGELSEFDVLGVTRGEAATESEIRRALDNAKPVKLRPGSSLLLIQSGALFPDGVMVTELGKSFKVASFSGVPPARRGGVEARTESVDPESYASSLRLAAARGGNDLILCYWGVLESENEHLPTKTVSWVPVVNWLLPDEVQHARIRLKLALVDVRTGNWTILSPPPFADNRISTSPRRAAVDQRQVERLKHKAYEAAVQELLKLSA
jgi:hypothetical protein